MPRERSLSSSQANFLQSAGLDALVDSTQTSTLLSGALEGNHFRCEVATGVWSLHWPRKQRPVGYAPTAAKDRTHDRPDTKTDRNPFDLANQHMTPPLVHVVPDPVSPEKPLVRVFENKFPVLTRPDKPGTCTVKASFVESFFPQVSAIGLHEVVVQHWRYNMCQALMTQTEVQLLFGALKHRFDYLSTVSRFVQLLENHGVRSGGSLPHPHAQLLGLPVVPGEQTGRYNVALKYWREHSRESIFETGLQKVLSHVGDDAADRLLLQNEHVVAFVPHAQERAYEMWIMPRRQCHHFSEATEEEVNALALASRSCLKMLYACNDDPDYNILMRTAPSRKIDQPGNPKTEPMTLWYRWHLVIIPHDNEWGGIKGT